MRSSAFDSSFGFVVNLRVGLTSLHQLDAIFSIFGASDRDKRLILQS